MPLITQTKVSGENLTRQLTTHNCVGVKEGETVDGALTFNEATSTREQYQEFTSSSLCSILIVATTTAHSNWVCSVHLISFVPSCSGRLLEEGDTARSFCVLWKAGSETDHGETDPSLPPPLCGHHPRTTGLGACSQHVHKSK